MIERSKPWDVKKVKLECKTGIDSTIKSLLYIFQSDYDLVQGEFVLASINMYIAH